jgi:pimeloyl-ACP methyl ester carboxylesterase
LVIIDGGGFEGGGSGGSGRAGRVFCAPTSRPGFVRRIYPLFSRAYVRPRTAADRRARASAIAITRTTRGLKAVTEIWSSFALQEHDLRAQAAGITTPTLLIWGRHDPVLPLPVGETAERLIPGSRLVVIESGHLPHTTNPAAVAAELIPFTDSAFGRDSQTADVTHSPTAMQERQPRPQ